MSYECRFCYNEGDDPNDFISPCCCSGTNLHVHKKCLNTWLLSKKGTEEYFKCKTCHCNYKRTTNDSINIIVENKLTTTALLSTSISAMALTLFMLGCGASIIFCNIILIILYLFAISYMAIVLNNNNEFWLIIILIFVAIYSNRKIKTFLTDLLLISAFILCSYHFIKDGWDILYKNIEKDQLMLFEAKMFDKFTNTYVTGVI